MYPRVGLGETSLAIQDQECQGVIWVIALLSQQCSTALALHGNEVKRWFALIALQPLRPAAAKVAYAIEYNYPVLGAHESFGLTLPY